MFGLPQLELPFFWNKPATPAGDTDKKRSHQGSRAIPPEEPRTIHLGGQEVSYVVRRSAKRRTLSLQVNTHGLRVAAPLKTKQRDIDEMLLTNARWVLAALKEWRHPAQLAARAWAPGLPIPLLGVTRPLRVAPGRAGLAKFDDTLILTVPRPDDEAAVRAGLRAAFKAEARDWFGTRLAHFAGRFGVDTPALRISQAESRWGSCSRDREGAHRVSLNWRMIHFEARLIDYVVAHEIAHVKHMHHGPRFWAAVAKLYPDYVNVRGEIKRRALELPEI